MMVCVDISLILGGCFTKLFGTLAWNCIYDSFTCKHSVCTCSEACKNTIHSACTYNSFC